MLIEEYQGEFNLKKFVSKYVDSNIPVVVRGYAKNWSAVKAWNGQFFKENYGSSVITTKNFRKNGEIILDKKRLDDYIDSVQKYESLFESGVVEEKPDYWHDVPIFELFSDLVKYVDHFDVEILPDFYRSEWFRHVQFFMSAPGSVTKLHFDTLRTHNLFFQISGRKRWVILPASQERFCGRKRWRWFDLDPESPDFTKYPNFDQACMSSVTVGPGDLLYIPPGVLHQVTSLDTCISFNIDFHTSSSVIKSIPYFFKGMPGKVMYYNLICLLGLVAKVSPKYLFSRYKSYLNFVS